MLLFFANHQSPSVLFETPARRPRRADYLPVFASACSWPLRRLRLRHRRHVRRGDARRKPPGAARRPVGHLALGHRRRVFLLGGHPVAQGHRRPRWPTAAGGFPIATTIIENLPPSSSDGITIGELYLFVILSSVYVCTMAIQGATTRLMFSMGRDRRPALRRGLGHVNPTSRRRPTRPSRSACSRPCRSSSPARSAALMSIAATGADLPQLLPVQPRRPRRATPGLAAQEGLVQPRQLGHAHQHPRPHLGRRDGHQHRPLGMIRCSATSAATGRGTHEPVHQQRSSVRRRRQSRACRHGPFFETIVGSAPRRRGDLLLRRRSGAARPTSKPTWRPARRSSARPPNSDRCGAAASRRSDRRAVGTSGQATTRGRRRRLRRARSVTSSRALQRDAGARPAASSRSPRSPAGSPTATSSSRAGPRPSASSSGWPATTRTCSASAAKSSTPRPWPRRASASVRR